MAEADHPPAEMVEDGPTRNRSIMFDPFPMPADNAVVKLGDLLVAKLAILKSDGTPIFRSRDGLEPATTFRAPVALPLNDRARDECSKHSCGGHDRINGRGRKSDPHHEPDDRAEEPANNSAEKENILPHLQPFTLGPGSPRPGVVIPTLRHPASPTRRPGHTQSPSTQTPIIHLRPLSQSVAQFARKLGRAAASGRPCTREPMK